jgi:hypothetical protein
MGMMLSLEFEFEDCTKMRVSEKIVALWEQASQNQSHSHSRGPKHKIEPRARTRARVRVVARSQHQSHIPEKQTTLIQIGFLELLETKKPLNGEV